jgi:DNA-binding transcriptional ArsR family regulator
MLALPSIGNQITGESLVPKASPATRCQQWTFLTNHAHVLLCIVRSPAILMRELALEIGITLRAVQHIISDLEQAGYLETKRQGRCNTYRIKTSRPLRHPIERHRTVASLVDLINDSPCPAAKARHASIHDARAKKAPRQSPNSPSPRKYPRVHSG